MNKKHKHHKTNNGNHLQPRLTKVAAAVLAVLSNHAQANSAKLVNPANSHAYQRLDSALDWNTAKSVCSNMGAHLATITSQAENAWLTTNFTNGVAGFWLGATDEVVEGTWKWITNETWSYTNWNSINGEPNNVGGNENYLNMWGTEPPASGSAGTWNDTPNSANWNIAYIAYLCEWEPTPTPKIVYTNNFSTSAGAEWTDPTIATSNGEKFLGTNEYGFGAISNTLTLNNLPTHTKVTVDFDLYIIQSWDGNGDVCGVACGPDNWQLTADGNNILYTNFSNMNGGGTQAYPNQLPPYGSGGTFTLKTGAFATEHLANQGDWGGGDATYRQSYTFAHTTANLALKFNSLQNEGNEGWGLDNVQVRIDNTVAAATDVKLLLTDNRTSVNPNMSVTYLAAISNLGPAAANNSILKAPAVANLTVTAITCNTVLAGAVCPTNLTPALLQGTGLIIPTLPVNGGMTFRITAKVAAMPTANSIRYTATVTKPTGVTETNSTNNTATDVDRVTRQPDLIITGIALNPATPAANGTFSATVTIKNQGAAIVDAGFIDVWANQATAPACGADGNAWAYIGTIAVGASKSLIVTGLTAGSAGSKTLRAFADSWCEVTESIETNNQLTKAYSVQ